MGKQQVYIPPLIGWLYDLVLWSFSVLIDLFFREVHPRGSWKIPRRGPIIIVAAPHANQVMSHIPSISEGEGLPCAFAPWIWKAD